MIEYNATKKRYTSSAKKMTSPVVTHVKIGDGPMIPVGKYKQGAILPYETKKRTE